MSITSHNEANLSWAVIYKKAAGELCLGKTMLTFRELGSEKPELETYLDNIEEAKTAKGKDDGYMLRVAFKKELSKESEEKNLKRVFFKFSGDDSKQRSDQAAECIIECLKFIELSKQTKMRINFLQEHDEFLRLYQRLIVSNAISDDEFWELLSTFRDDPTNKVKELREFGMVQGLPNKLIKFEPKTTSNPELNFTSDDIEMLYRVYPELKAKMSEEVTEAAKEGKTKKDKRVQFIELQVKKCTELAGGFKDIEIEDMYKIKAPKIKFSPDVEDIFKNTYYPLFNKNKGNGLHRSAVEAGDVLANQEEPLEEDKYTGMVNRLNRHSKRLLCDMIKGTPFMSISGKPIPQYYKGSDSRYSTPMKTDTEPNRVCASKFLSAISSLKTKTSLQGYVIKSEVAESAWSYINREATISDFIQSQARNLSGKLLLAVKFFKEAQLLLTVFYRQWPVTRHKEKGILERLEILIAELISKAEKCVGRDPQLKSAYEQILALMTRAKELYQIAMRKYKIAR